MYGQPRGSVLSAPDAHHVGSWRIYNVFYQSGQSSEGVGLFLHVSVAIINPLDAAHDMTKHPLRYVRSDAGAAHQ